MTLDNTPPAAIADDLEQVIAAQWAAELKHRPHLFNGTVAVLHHATSHCLQGALTEYRRFLTQVRQPRLRPRLDLMQLAVAARIDLDDGILVARRGAHLSTFQHWWEFPSGALDQRAIGADGQGDLVAQLRWELSEELGLSPREYSLPRPHALVVDPRLAVAAVILALRLPLSLSALQERFVLHPQPEHTALAVLPRNAPLQGAPWGQGRLTPVYRRYLQRLVHLPPL
ncbi:MAG: hypothetical protein H7831_01760 [Magnetococcus sp. WYHC-3]